MTGTVPLLEARELPESGGGRDLQVFPGERLAVLGGEASGKSRLLRILAGLHPVGAGRLFWLGRALSTLSGAERAGGIGVLFRDPDGGFLCATPAEEVGLVPAARGLRGEELTLCVREAFSGAGLPWALSERELSTLSASQRYRVAVAAVLASPPRLLLIDEPGAMLSEEGESAFARLLADHVRIRGMATVVFTSRAARAALFADRLILL